MPCVSSWSWHCQRRLSVLSLSAASASAAIAYRPTHLRESILYAPCSLSFPDAGAANMRCKMRYARDKATSVMVMAPTNVSLNANGIRRSTLISAAGFRRPQNSMIFAVTTAFPDVSQDARRVLING
jgi:hypothetical protein